MLGEGGGGVFPERGRGWEKPFSAVTSGGEVPRDAPRLREAMGDSWRGWLLQRATLFTAKQRLRLLLLLLWVTKKSRGAQIFLALFLGL